VFQNNGTLTATVSSLTSLRLVFGNLCKSFLIRSYRVIVLSGPYLLPLPAHSPTRVWAGHSAAMGYTIRAT